MGKITSQRNSPVVYGTLQAHRLCSMPTSAVERGLAMVVAKVQELKEGYDLPIGLETSILGDAVVEVEVAFVGGMMAVARERGMWTTRSKAGCV